ncbi:MAG: FtsX-like permease family protein [Gracilibacteraceae bacterium]|jgi:putative ABC transport system permease protein|nr:FtsX-like permease family protein [Gracilibacteraceae bacterium]
MTSAELALRNVRKSFRDYAVYFMTLTFGICIFYVFNSIGSQQAVMDLSSSQASTMKMLDRLIGDFSLFISVILCFLIIYANGFLVKRRKKEFGLYLTLGMERRQVSRILVLETVFMGLISLAAGLLLGIALSQGMSLVTAALLGVKIDAFRFVFAFGTVAKTIVYFSAAFALTLFFNVLKVGRQQLIDLIYAGRRNETNRAPRPFLAALIFTLAVFCLAASYFMLLGDLLGGASLNIIIALGAAGTFLFFFALSGFLMQAARRKSLYLKNLNMFVLRQLSSKINTAYVSMTIVCLMLFISICTLSSGLGIARAVAAELRFSAPYDATLVMSATGESGEDYVNHAPVDILAAARDKGVDVSSFAGVSKAAVFYDAEGLVPPFTGRNGEKTLLYLLSLSDYNAALAMQGLPLLSLGANEYAVNFGATNADWSKILTQYADTGGSLTLGGRELRTNAALLRHHVLEVRTHLNLDMILVVPDDTVSGRQAKKEVLFINYPQSGLEYEQLCLGALSGFTVTTADGAELSGSVETRIQVNDYAANSTATIAYLAIYMGVVFLVASATVLAIGQLSEASDNCHRYSLLHKLGADDKMLNGALFTQILIYFGAPLLLALVHSVAGISAAGKIMTRIGGMNILGTSILAALFIILIYGGYFLATYWSGRNMIKTAYDSRRR